MRRARGPRQSPTSSAARMFDSSASTTVEPLVTSRDSGWKFADSRRARAATRRDGAEAPRVVRLVEPLGGELADRLEHPEASLLGRRSEALVDQRLRAASSVRVADALRGFERAAAGERRRAWRTSAARPAASSSYDHSIVARRVRCRGSGSPGRLASRSSRCAEPLEELLRRERPSSAPRRARARAAGCRDGGRARRASARRLESGDAAPRSEKSATRLDLGQRPAPGTPRSPRTRSSSRDS